MGAATTMIYAHKDNRVKAIVMDSPFADFSILAKDLVLKQIKLPNLLITGALKILGSTIKKKNGLNIEKLKPIDSSPKTKIPAIFIHAKDDQLINNKHSDMLFAVYGGKNKKLIKCDGGHNTRRVYKIIKTIGEFFYEHLVNDQTQNDINKEEDNNIFKLDLNSEKNKDNEIIKENDKDEINSDKSTENSINEQEKNKNEINKSDKNTKDIIENNF